MKVVPILMPDQPINRLAGDSSLFMRFGDMGEVAMVRTNIHEISKQIPVGTDIGQLIPSLDKFAFFIDVEHQAYCQHRHPEEEDFIIPTGALETTKRSFSSLGYQFIQVEDVQNHTLFSALAFHYLRSHNAHDESKNEGNNIKWLFEPFSCGEGFWEALVKNFRFNNMRSDDKPLERQDIIRGLHDSMLRQRQHGPRQGNPPRKLVWLCYSNAMLQPDPQIRNILFTPLNELAIYSGVLA